MIIFILMLLLVLGLMLLYSYYHIMQLLPEHLHTKKIAITILVGMLGMMILNRLVLGFFINAWIIFILFDLILLITHRLEMLSKYVRWIYQKGFMVIGIAVVVSIYGIYNVQNFVTTTYDITIAKDIADKKIVVATDMHISTAVGKKQIDKFVSKTKEIDPDMVFLIGDIYDESSKDSDIEHSYIAFEKLAKEYPVYFVSGNHEVGQGVGGVLEGKGIADKLRAAGITVLSDEVVELEDMYIIGRQDETIKKRRGINEIVNGLSNDKAWVVLDHQPTDYQKEEKIGTDLVISGHTHAGQIFPMGQLDHLFKINDLNYGKIAVGNFQAVVSSGMGVWGFPMRTSKHCEIVVLNIRGNQ